jgi:hypothetical protein
VNIAVTPTPTSAAYLVKVSIALTQPIPKRATETLSSVGLSRLSIIPSTSTAEMPGYGTKSTRSKGVAGDGFKRTTPLATDLCAIIAEIKGRRIFITRAETSARSIVPPLVAIADRFTAGAPDGEVK